MCVHFVPVAAWKISAVRCGEPPLPELAKVTAPGLAFEKAISSLTELGANDGLAISTNGSSHTSEIGVNAVSGLYGSFA